MAVQKMSDLFRSELRDVLITTNGLAAALRMHPMSVRRWPLKSTARGPRNALLFRVGDVAAYLDLNGLGSAPTEALIG